MSNERFFNGMKRRQPSTPVMVCKKHGIQPIVRACEKCAAKMVTDFAANQEHLKKAAEVLNKAADELVKAGKRIDELENGIREISAATCKQYCSQLPEGEHHGACVYVVKLLSTGEGGTKMCDCGKRPAGDERPCPYSESINEDPTRVCNCCGVCRDECAQDI